MTKERIETKDNKKAAITVWGIAPELKSAFKMAVLKNNTTMKAVILAFLESYVKTEVVVSEIQDGLSDSQSETETKSSQEV